MVKFGQRTKMHVTDIYECTLTLTQDIQSEFFSYYLKDGNTYEEDWNTFIPETPDVNTEKLTWNT
jgi:hypothetical protein